MMFLKIFYLTPYQIEAASDDVFYIQFYERQKQFRTIYTDLG